MEEPLADVDQALEGLDRHTAAVEEAAPELAGDFDLDGKVIASDLDILGGNWQQAVASYADGDTNGDGRVNATDLNSVGINWQFGNTPAAPLGSTVPEPNGYALVLSGLAGLLALRRKK